MTSEPLGIGTSSAEVTNISAHGIWLLTQEEELFLSYEDFPWFQDVPLRHILNVQEPAPGHYYWPDLDVDVGVESIRNPERFPLKWNHDA